LECGDAVAAVDESGEFFAVLQKDLRLQ
jgi:hypothetical protein